MKSYLRIWWAVIVIPCSCFAQVGQPPATLDELQYLRFMLMSVASIDHHSRSAKTYEDGLIKLFGLNAQESAAIHAAGQEMNALLKQLSQSASAVAPSRVTASPAQAATLSALATQREQRLEILANRILNQVRSETAARLRAPARVAASKGRK
jgi:hypothetical protein